MNRHKSFAQCNYWAYKKPPNRFVNTLGSEAMLLLLPLKLLALSFHSPEYLKNHEGLIFDKNNDNDYECTNGVVVTLKSNYVFYPFLFT